MPLSGNWKVYSFVAAVIIMAAFCAPNADASDTVTYIYTGNDYTEACGELHYLGGPCTAGSDYTTNEGVNGWFTISEPLGDDLVFSRIVPISYGFSDGAFIYDPTNSYLFEFLFGTDAQGKIDEWAVHIISDCAGGVGPCTGVWWLVPQAGSVDTYNVPSGLVVDEGGDTRATYANNFNDPGTWTLESSGGPTTTPEPSSVALMSTALLALAFVARKRTARSLPVF